jgi:transposase
MQDAQEFPQDVDACHELLRQLTQAYSRLQRIHDELLGTCSSIQEAQQKLEQERDELQLTIKELMGRLYGRRSERSKYSPDQLPLDFGDRDLGEPINVEPEPSDEPPTDESATTTRTRKRKKRPARRGEFPEHLERRTERIEPDLPEGVKPEDCRSIGVDVVETLEFERPRLWVRRVEYPKYIVPQRRDLGVLQAGRSGSLIPGGSFGVGIATEVLFSKFALHVPLYRQQDTLAQLGWSPNRSTLCQIVATSAELLTPLAKLLEQRVLASCVVNTDDTPVTLLTPGENMGSRTARFWIYRGRAPAPYNVFAFTDNRSRAGPDEFLQDFEGTICGDCYSGYVNIETVTDGRILFSACNAHARRYVHKAREQQPGLTSLMLAIYGELYDIEDRARLMNDQERLVLRQRESVPLMERLKSLVEGAEARAALPKSKLGIAIGYLRNHWEALSRYLSDGQLPIDNNDAERDLRRVAVGRKNWIFVGSQKGGYRTSTILSVIASAHRHDLDVWAYLYDVLQRLSREQQDVESLLPDVWKRAKPDKVRTFRAEEKEARAQIRRFKRAERRQARALTSS